jgi:riboflavin synthase
MFTGIVTEVGKVVAVRRETDRLAFRIEMGYKDLIEGESIAVGGACLTIVSKGENWFEVEAIVTTRSRTWFGDLQVGDEVNLERSVQLGDRMGGHFVQGHVDGVGEVVNTKTEADALLLDVSVPDEIDELTIPHGSVSIDGVSLTVNEMPAPNVLQVALIPYTLEHTTLGNLKAGDKVHLEGDMIGKYIRRLLRDRQGENPN